MEKIYQNFDGLDVSFKGALPIYILDQLKSAKYDAIEQHGKVYIKLGAAKVPVSVDRTGAKGGYSFIIDTGIDRETWFIANSTFKNRWNIRVSLKSMALAIHGYKKAKRNMLEVLDLLEVKGEYREENEEKGLRYNFPQERIARVDFCIDFKTDHFEPKVKCFVAHQHSHREFIQSATNNFIAKGKVIESARIGTMPNKQIALYNKTNEIIFNQKLFWWDIWDIDKDTFKGEIWRVEARAGKHELKKWNIKTFEELETRVGNVMWSIFKDIRYVVPNKNDSNSARWPNANFWDIATNTTYDELLGYSSNAKKGRIVKDLRSNIARRYKILITGIIIGYTAILGKPISELPQVLDTIKKDIINYAHQFPDEVEEKHDRTLKKYFFLDD